MTIENIKTPITGTPFIVIPSKEFFFRDEGDDAYQIESQSIVVDDVNGCFEISHQGGVVEVTALFGASRWGETFGDPIIVDDVRYCVIVRSAMVRLAEFNLEACGDNLTFSMLNLDHTKKVLGLDIPEPVTEADPAFTETRHHIIEAVSTFIKELTKRHPSLSEGFKQVVATLELARLRKLQDSAWREMSTRTEAIYRCMQLVPEEADRLATWKFSSQETGPPPISATRDGRSITATGVHKVTVELTDGAAVVVSSLLDGTGRTEIIRPK
jgi:hypothetical protein